MQPAYPSVITQNSSPQGVTDLMYEDQFDPHFVTAIVGKPDAGKTTLLRNLFTNPQMYANKFDAIIQISPKPIVQAASQYWNATLDCVWLAEKLQELAQIFSKKSGRPGNVAIIFDDVVAQIKDNEQSEFLTTLFNNRRHVLPNAVISIVVTTQKYNLIPLRFRTILTSIFVFAGPKNEFDMIWKELIGGGKEVKAQILGLFEKGPEKSFLLARLNPIRLFFNFKPFKSVAEMLNQIQEGFLKRPNTEMPLPVQAPPPKPVVQQPQAFKPVQAAPRVMNLPMQTNSSANIPAPSLNKQPAPSLRTLLGSSSKKLM